MPNANVFPPAQHGFSIEVAGSDLVFKTVPLNDRTPTGAQVAAAAGYSDPQAATVLHMLPNGEVEDIRPTEVVTLPGQGSRFIVVATDRSYRLSIDDKRFDWPAQCISGSILRNLGGVQADKLLYMERQDKADAVIEDHDVVDLGRAGIETFYSRAPNWVLNVQGVRLDVQTPTIVVRDAMHRAGFDTDQGWHIFLKVAGQPKQPLELTSVVDLRAPGIEKIRLTPKDVSNGEAAQALRRDFPLLDFDERFLDKHFVRWETVLDNQRRWLLIFGYPVPAGFSEQQVTLALEVPSSYPGAQIDMFYVFPNLVLNSGQMLECTQVQEAVCGQSYQRWSRHRSDACQWRPDTDNVVTHLALVESALAKEVQQ
ncbi:multiubiquitin domain-containing protein [Achromobacter animicus]